MIHRFKMNNIFCGMKKNGQFWFRIFGIGISGKDITIHSRVFSERYGFVKSIQIRNWLFRFLPKWRSGDPASPKTPYPEI